MPGDSRNSSRNSPSLRPAIQRGPEGQLKNKTKSKQNKTWGRDKQKRACEIRGLRGQIKNAPSPTKGPGRCASEGPCDPLPNKKATKNPEQEGTNPPPSEGLPLALTRARGGRRAPRACRRSSHWLGLLVKRVKPQNKTKGENTNQGKEAKKHPCRLASQEKGPRKGRASSSPVSSRRIPKTRGAQKGTPRKTPRSRTHGQNGRNKQVRRDKTKANKKSKTSACGGVLLLPELYLLKETKTENDDDDDEKNKGRENEPRKQQT